MGRYGQAAQENFSQNDRNFRFPEKKAGMPKEGTLTQEEALIYEMAKAEEEARPEIIEFENFEPDKGFYTPEKIALDQAKLDRFDQARIDSPKSKHGIILEYIIRRNLEMSDWAGENCMTCETTLYDDEKNKTDFVLEFMERNEDGKLMLHRCAVDVTSTQNDQTYRKKQERLLEGLDNGVMGRLKYFTSEAEKKKVGFIKNVPKIVLALNLATIEKVSREFVLSHEMFETSKKEENPVVRKKKREAATDLMANNPVQILFLKQISEQMQDQIMHVMENLFAELELRFDDYLTGNEDEDRLFLAELADIYDLATKDWRASVQEIPDYPARLIDKFFKRKNFINRLDSNVGDKSRSLDRNLIRQHLFTIKRLKPILDISRKLIEQKEAQIDPKQLAQSKINMQNNIVLRNTALSLEKFRLPKGLEDKLPPPLESI